MKCPSCQSDRLRRSRHRPEDGVWRSIFYTAYRCRNCGKRSQHLTSGLLLGATVVAVVALTFILGFFFGGVHDVLSTVPAPSAPAANSAPAETVEREAPATPAPSAATVALAAAAEGGDPTAQMQLGLAHLNGRGVERDSAAGLKWLERAAEQGLPEAQYALGTIYQSGRGALQSFPLAFGWYERAAQQNHAEAQYALGLMYRLGQGVAVDKPKAYIWFNLSAAQGHERARDARDSVLTALTPEQVLAAQQAAREWRPVANK